MSKQITARKYNQAYWESMGNIYLMSIELQITEDELLSFETTNKTILEELRTAFTLTDLECENIDSRIITN